MKKFLFSYIFACSALFGQPQNNIPPFAPSIPFQTEVIAMPRIDGDFTVYFTYKIPYRLLVFERESDSFIASFRIIVEISDKDGKLIDRDIKDNKISVNNFEDTNEREIYLQDYLEFKVKPDNYKVVAIISDRNSTGERPLKPVELKLEKEEKQKSLYPLVIKQTEIICKEKNSMILANAGGNIPFGNDEYSLVIPMTDTSLTEIDVTLENNGEEVFSGKINESFVERIGLTNCEDLIIVTEIAENNSIRNFIVKNINEKLYEGELVVTIKNDEKELDENIKLKVIWFNKPFSLLNPEKAIELLSFIESEPIVDELLSADEDDYPKVLQNYWKKFDPTPETSFNEIMFEYYSRVDYAAKEFGSIANNNGVKTDRGMVYIKFGKPDKIERTSDHQGEVIEAWTYTSSQKKFTFIDKVGTGNFKLTEI